MGQGEGASPAAPSGTSPRIGTERAIFANACVFLVLIFAAALRWFRPDFFYLSVQEDQYLEWATFWAFLLAAATASLAAVQNYGQTQRLPWFLAGVGLFCFFASPELQVVLRITLSRSPLWRPSPEICPIHFKSMSYVVFSPSLRIKFQVSPATGCAGSYLKETSVEGRSGGLQAAVRARGSEK